jgi:YVTN family beta-propeller protein
MAELGDRFDIRDPNTEPFGDRTMRLSLTTFAAALALACAAPVFAAPHSDLPTYAVTSSIAGPDGFWDLLAVDAVSHRLFVGHGDRVMAVDLDTGKVNPKLVEGQRVHAAIPLAGNRVLSTNGSTNTATILDADTGKILATIPTGASPDDAVLDPATGLVLVMDHKGGDITLVDPKTMTSVGRIDVGGELELAAADGQGRVFVNIEDQSKMAVIDTKSRKVAAIYALPGCEGPTGLAMDPTSGLVLSACDNETAVVLHAADGTVAATLKIGKGPDGAMFDPAHKLFFVPCGGDGTLSVIAEQSDGSLKVVASVPTATGARTGAFDPRTGNIYLPTADFDFKNVAPGKRPALIPGTFRILVVSQKP